MPSPTPSPSPLYVAGTTKGAATATGTRIKQRPEPRGLPVGNGKECVESCSPFMRRWQQLEDSRKKNVELLGKNYAFLANISASQSKFLKVNSNRVLILGNIDRVKQEQEKLRIDISKEGCQPCLRQLTKNQDEISED